MSKMTQSKGAGTNDRLDEAEFERLKFIKSDWEAAGQSYAGYEAAPWEKIAHAVSRFTGAKRDQALAWVGKEMGNDILQRTMQVLATLPAGAN